MNINALMVNFFKIKKYLEKNLMNLNALMVNYLNH